MGKPDIMAVMVKDGVPQPIDLSMEPERERIIALLRALQALPASERDISPLLRQFPSPTGTYAKSQLIGAYRQLVAEEIFSPDPALERRLRGRPVRTVSGVAPVAVLTKPFACPGKCIFCPTQEEAPKSYLDGEPGVLRALQYAYDPFAQTSGRIQALAAIGHPVDKIELLILGGTWSYYPEAYRQTFLLRCFEALNESPSATLDEALLRNETAPHRNVGLVIETRPDCVTPAEVKQLRTFGVTKVQLGAQSFDDQLLYLNDRGHTVQQTRDAMRRLRLAGFKIVLHWMPNLYGATPESDFEDFAKLWDDPALRPDELKIYPTALLKGTRLFELWEQGNYTPYSEETLIELLVKCKSLIQPYCRVNRLMRDIPASYIVAGTQKSNLRQLVQQRMQQIGSTCRCIRCREIRAQEILEALEEIYMEPLRYETDATEEHFLQFVTSSGYLVGFLRLSLPKEARDGLPIPEIRTAAMIREVHVYGPAQKLGRRVGGVQHRGLGTELLEYAAIIARDAGFRELAVIAAVGTRRYYHARGFDRGHLYPIMKL